MKRPSIRNQDSISTRIQHSFVCRMIQRFPSFGRKLANAGDMAHAIEALQGSFNVTSKYKNGRELVWLTMANHIGTTQHVTGLEFGVGHGYSTAWWLSRLSDTSSWHAYDTFEGNPTNWREHSAGTWSSEGSVPAIEDDRVIWHVGNVMDISALPEQPIGTVQLFLLDLNLLGPTTHVLDLLAKSEIASGLIYFDDFYDPLQRDLVLRRFADDFSLDLLAFSPKSAAFTFDRH